jgi:hypothetical protein
VIEKHGGWEHAAICTTEAGAIKVFDDLQEAFKEADDCQDGIVIGDEEVDLDVNEEKFVEAFDKNLKVIEACLKGTGVQKELRKAVNNLISLKKQIVV